MARIKHAAVRWPNGLGWDVGAAEVRDLVTCLRAFAPCRPECLGVSERTGKRIYREMHRQLDVPLGTDPVEAVRLCINRGEFVADY